jgi:hypothetical protein
LGTYTKNAGGVEGAISYLDYCFELEMLQRKLPMCCMPTGLLNVVFAIPKQACFFRIHIDTVDVDQCE